MQETPFAPPNMSTLNQAADALLPLLSEPPRCALILGSGWSGAVESMSIAEELPYDAIPGLGSTGVSGHKGRLLIGTLEGVSVLVFQGRRHWYEGLGWTPIAIPVYLAKRSGASTVLLTNAAGGITKKMQPGDLMVIQDHINMIGTNPLVGPHNPFWGPRFPDQSSIYTPALQTRLIDAAKATGARAHTGVYLATSGPVYETPSEVKSFARLGADAVGMSTVPEAILANACNLQVAAISCITNMAAGIEAATLTHDAVINETEKAATQLAGTVTEFVRDLGSSQTGAKT
jgi:purine-nucleoside phosphorylase